MQKKSQNYYPNNFKDQLWSEVSTSCSQDEWCYSFAERRLFYILFGFTIFLGVIYFSGITNEVASIYKSSKKLELLNEAKMKTMESASVTATAIPSNNTYQASEN